MVDTIRHHARALDLTIPPSVEFIAMIKAAILFLVVAVVLAVLGFGGLVGLAVGIVKILFWIAAAIAVLLFVLGYTIFREVT